MQGLGFYVFFSPFIFFFFESFLAFVFFLRSDCLISFFPLRFGQKEVDDGVWLSCPPPEVVDIRVVEPTDPFVRQLGIVSTVTDLGTLQGMMESGRLRVHFSLIFLPFFASFLSFPSSYPPFSPLDPSLGC